MYFINNYLGLDDINGMITINISDHIKHLPLQKQCL